MNIMISGGGTGGHIYPALTIYRTLEAMVDANFLYVGTERGLESRIVPKEGIPFTTLPVQGLQRKLSLDTLVTAGKTLSSLWKARHCHRYWWLCMWSSIISSCFAWDSYINSRTKCSARHNE